MDMQRGRMAAKTRSRKPAARHRRAGELFYFDVWGRMMPGNAREGRDKAVGAIGPGNLKAPKLPACENNTIGGAAWRIIRPSDLGFKANLGTGSL